MRKRLLIPFVLLAAFGALAVAGCGGGDDTSSTTAGVSGATGASGTALTQDEFVKQGQAICAAGNKVMDQAANDTFTGGKPTAAQIEQYVNDVAAPSIQGQIDDLRALTPPADMADDVSAMLDDAQSAVDQIKDNPQLLAASDNAGPFADANKEAAALGLTECGSGN